MSIRDRIKEVRAQIDYFTWELQHHKNELADAEFRLDQYEDELENLLEEVRESR